MLTSKHKLTKEQKRYFNAGDIFKLKKGFKVR